MLSCARRLSSCDENRVCSMFKTKNCLYIDTLWVRMLNVFFVLTLVNIYSLSHRCQRIDKRSCRCVCRANVIECVHEKTTNFTIVFNCMRTKAKWLRKCWRDRQKSDTSSWEKIVFYEKYRELASHSCQAKNIKNSRSQFEFREVIRFCFVVIDFTSIKWIFFCLINYSQFVFFSRSMRFRWVYKILLMKVLY
jgi:hypothetical protein